jgi:hypothetical protein
LNTLSYYAKCITAAIVAGYGTYQVAMADGVITQAEWVQIVLAVLASLSVVWGIPNALAKTPVASAPMSVAPPVQPATIFAPPAADPQAFSVPEQAPVLNAPLADLSARVQAGI